MPVNSYGGMEKVMDTVIDKYPNYDFNKCQAGEQAVSKKALRWQKKILGLE